MVILKLELERSKRSNWVWTKQNTARSVDIMKVLEEFKEYLPMTERQIFYQLLHYTDAPHWQRQYEGKTGQVDVYAALGRVLKWMRIDGKINHDVVIDEHRIITRKEGYTDAESFIDLKLKYLDYGYSRCMAQKQPRHIEVWIEKAALLSLVKPVADEFCRRVIVRKGYGSITFQTQFYARAVEAMGYGQTPTILYFGDWDPSGENMIHAAMQTMKDELGLDGIDYYRCGLNPEHFNTIQKNPVPIKNSDRRSKKFIKNHGTTAYELDAMHPEKLKTLVRDSIMKFTDMGAYDENKAQEVEESRWLVDITKDIKNYAREKFNHG
ncbi:hypothetical protein SBF1_2970004 [Candidatus Desulfosporosinus infrequens]|uniref:Uncharacterized protein n=1 Tax=Candidatus Desulfosporosinus infrequens TaxID=2043169 RepID=A0A2U3KW61_9FIRM|nr:hypothetical protein SBF1_2970004 [Candidatus Desulfosporosinus infrequens]